MSYENNTHMVIRVGLFVSADSMGRNARDRKEYAMIDVRRKIDVLDIMICMNEQRPEIRIIDDDSPAIDSLITNFCRLFLYQSMTGYFHIFLFHLYLQFLYIQAINLSLIVLYLYLIICVIEAFASISHLFYYKLIEMQFEEFY